jgi:hypothetical protein
VRPPQAPLSAANYPKGNRHILYSQHFNLVTAFFFCS